MEEQLPSARISLRVQPESLHLFTTLLQSGIELKTSTATELGTFLCQLPGFTLEYITSKVETIFLDGFPVDDLTQPFTGENAVLALSAAMPGLAGAIFRRNSIHSTLRTQTKSPAHVETSQKNTTVTLKLFNSIAKERGETLLATGITLKASKVLSFLKRRPEICDNITEINVNNEVVNLTTLLEQLPQFQTISFKVQNPNG